MSIFEAIGVAYTILATALFTVQLFYVCSQGLNHVRRLIRRGQTEETLRLQRADSIERELAKAS